MLRIHRVMPPVVLIVAASISWPGRTCRCHVAEELMQDLSPERTTVGEVNLAQLDMAQLVESIRPRPNMAQRRPETHETVRPGFAHSCNQSAMQEIMRRSASLASLGQWIAMFTAMCIWRLRLRNKILKEFVVCVASAQEILARRDAGSLQGNLQRLAVTG
ncbi:hypothetical protein POSPLADRAFT_1032415 [Postia placenta MAD-698-R-SB12]|uniref:Uncharacterized protein n=1 Tax=Postia placenta MAD-698-R-SB12 TaxID=670580 RepID=A0A1X6N654_9APHY|nr:hypothetical protein POSPLADRAFT_1032415 [Postia placenta MAD-698-R-SB12]OSX63893.1 hypothetical protein POSPLADRAFT_1032415 [Postia placenta MAD-698-R-SB12]